MSFIRHISLFALVLGSVGLQAKAPEAKKSTERCDDQLYTFTWNSDDKCRLPPRGGSSKGVKVTLDSKPHAGWEALQEEGLSQFEKDRRAILAMAGPYRASFEFLEVVGYTPEYTQDEPYQSWGTEYVYVVEDAGEYISLQHVLVMNFAEKDGKKSEPVVVKHWRQDWQYQPRKILAYKGNNIWETQKISRKASKGVWSQSVYQVDDSPRYASYGQWQHMSSFSTWKSEETWRPLPRREYSVRKDYQVLEGFNRHTILPNGWVHEEENLKRVLDIKDESKAAPIYLAKEQGVNRYERIVDHDFSAGDVYLQRSGEFWRDVREIWTDTIQSNSHISMQKKVDGVPMFVPLFKYAKELEEKTYNSVEGKAFIQETLKPYLFLK